MTLLQKLLKIAAINNMNKNTNSNIPRNDNNLDTLSRTREEFDPNVQESQNKKLKDCIIRYTEHNHYQAVINLY